MFSTNDSLFLVFRSWGQRKEMCRVVTRYIFSSLIPIFSSKFWSLIPKCSKIWSLIPRKFYDPIERCDQVMFPRRRLSFINNLSHASRCLFVHSESRSHFVFHDVLRNYLNSAACFWKMLGPLHITWLINFFKTFLVEKCKTRMMLWLKENTLLNNAIKIDEI